MRHRAGAGLRRAPGLERNNWLSHPAGLRRKRLKRPQIADPLDIQSQHSNAGVLQQGLTDLGQTRLGLIANRHHISQRQCPALHGQIDRDIGTLSDNRHSAVDLQPAVLIRPKRHTIQIIDKPITIWSNNRHVFGCRQQLLLQIGPVFTF